MQSDTLTTTTSSHLIPMNLSGDFNYEFTIHTVFVCIYKFYLCTRYFWGKYRNKISTTKRITQNSICRWGEFSVNFLVVSEHKTRNVPLHFGQLQPAMASYNDFVVCVHRKSKKPKSTLSHAYYIFKQTHCRFYSLHCARLLNSTKVVEIKFAFIVFLSYKY